MQELGNLKEDEKMTEMMSQEAKKSRNEYYRRWRAANPEKVKEKNRRYWERRAAREKENQNEQTEHN